MSVETGSPVSPAEPPFHTAAIVGVGMMGGSLGMAMRARGLAQRVIGSDLNQDTLALALERGAIDVAASDVWQCVEEADLVVLATPVGVIPGLLASLTSHIRLDALITDLGSTKANIVAAGERCFGLRFIGGHPMAGLPSGGIAAAQPDLFQSAAWAVVRAQSFALEQDLHAARLAGLAAALGARPVPLDAARHDRLVALVSHLPHLIAFAFADAVAEDPDAELARCLAGGSYRDLTRVAGADPDLWQDIFLDNREDLLKALDAFETRLQALRRSIEMP